MNIKSHHYKVIDNNCKFTTIIEDLDTKELYVQKEVNNEKLTEEKIKELMPVIKDNPAILPVIDFQHSKVQNNNIILVTKFFKNGTLREFLEKNKNYLTEDKKQIIIHGIAFAMMHFHLHDVYSGNLSKDQIFIDENCYPYVDFTNFSSIKEKNIDDKEKIDLKSKDILSFVVIFYEIMAGVNIVINDKNKNIIPDLSLIKNEAYRSFLQKNWSNGSRQKQTFMDIYFNYFRVKETDPIKVIEYYLKICTYKLLYMQNFKNESHLLNDMDDAYTYVKLLFAGYNAEKCENILGEIVHFLKKAFSLGNIDALIDYYYYIESKDTYLKMAADLGKIHAMENYFLLSENQQENIQYIKKAADLGLCSAMRLYGFHLFKGDIIPQDLNESIKYTKMSAKNGHIEGMVEYANHLYYGKIIPENKKKAAKYYKMAADLGSEIGIKSYANVLYEGDGIDENKVEALKYFKILADKGNSEDICDYINKFMSSNIEELKYDEIINYIKKEIEKGNHKCNEHFLWLVRKNKGIPVDKREAAQYYKLAADIGDPNDAYQYALLCDNGDLIPENKEDAVNYYKKAADDGNIDALFKFVNMLKNDEIDFDKKGSYRPIYYKKASENGIAIAMNEYGLILKNSKKTYEEAVKLFKKAADKGNMEAMFNYGVMLKNGEGIEQNEEESDKCFNIVVDSDDFISLAYYAKMINIDEENPEKIFTAFLYLKNRSELGYENARFALQSIKRIETGSQAFLIGRTKFFKHEAENDDCEAINKYASMLAYGIGVQENIKEAIKYYKYAIDKQYYRSAVEYSNLLLAKGKEIFSYTELQMHCDYILQINKKILNSITDVDIEEEESLNVEYYIMAANIGDVNAMFKYGCMLSYGDGIPANKKLAIKYFKMAIDKNDPRAMFQYAYMLTQGEGIQINFQEAAKYYKIAADMDKSEAMNNYGILLKLGLGVPIDKKEAAKFFRKAAKKGLIEGMYNYGKMLIEGNGISENKVKGAHYLKKAADKNYGDAALLYATLLEKGDGIPVNIDEAIRYYKIASENDELAQSELIRLHHSFSNAI